LEVISLEQTTDPSTRAITGLTIEISTATGSRLHTFPADTHVTHVAFGRDDEQFLALYADGAAEFRSATDGHILRSFKLAGAKQFGSQPTISSNGAQVATSETDDVLGSCELIFRSTIDGHILEAIGGFENIYCPVDAVFDPTRGEFATTLPNGVLVRQPILLSDLLAGMSTMHLRGLTDVERAQFGL
jgi:hypothetical protein